MKNLIWFSFSALIYCSIDIYLVLICLFLLSTNEPTADFCPDLTSIIWFKFISNTSPADLLCLIFLNKVSKNSPLPLNNESLINPNKILLINLKKKY